MEKRSVKDFAEQVMTTPDAEGLRVRRLVNKEETGASMATLEVGEIPPGKAHHMHRHPNAEQIALVLEGSALQYDGDGKAVRISEGDVVFLEKGEWHSVVNDTDRPVRLSVVYGGVGSPEEAGYEVADESQWVQLAKTVR
jgi:quercetin dioxygenase-like cupin family protein